MSYTSFLLLTAVASIVRVANGGCSNGIQSCNRTTGLWNAPSENTRNASRDFRHRTILLLLLHDAGLDAFSGFL